jgi:hypothetical protein
MRPFAADIADALFGEASRDARKQFLQFCVNVF